MFKEIKWNNDLRFVFRTFDVTPHNNDKNTIAPNYYKLTLMYYRARRQHN